MSKSLRWISNYFKEQNNVQSEPIQSDIAAITSWIKKSPHIKARTDEQLLLSFLRCCHFSLEETKIRIENFYALKSDFPEVLQNRLVDDSMMELFRTGIHIIPKQPSTLGGPRVIITQFAKYDPKKWGGRDVFKLMFMLLEILAHNDQNASEFGIMHIIDYRDASLEQMMQFDPFLLKKVHTLIDRGFPLIFQDVHILNLRKECQTIYNYLSAVLPTKLPFKFYVHKKAEEIYAYLPCDAMTVEYGGRNGYKAEAIRIWEQKLLSYKDYFANDINFKTNEKLRVNLNCIWKSDNLCGIKGSFKKLNVD